MKWIIHFRPGLKEAFMGFKKTIRAIALVLLAAVLLSGCWDAMDINKKDIATAVLVDKEDEDYVIYVEIANLVNISNQSTDNSGTSSVFFILSGNGPTFAAARRSLDSKMDKPLFLGTVGILIITVDLLKGGIGEYMNRMRQDVTYRKIGFIVSTMEEPLNILTARSENEASVGNAAEKTLENMIGAGNAVEITTADVLEYTSGKHAGFLLPNVDIESSQPTLNGYSVIHENHYIGFLPFSQARGAVYFLNPKGKWVYTVPYGENIATIEAALAGKSIQPHYTNGSIRFDVNFTFHSKVKYLTQGNGLDKKAQAELKENLSKALADEIYQTIVKAQKGFHCDYLGFKDAFRISYPHEYEDMVWDDEFVKAQFFIQIKTSLDPGGAMNYNPGQQ